MRLTMLLIACLCLHSTKCNLCPHGRSRKQCRRAEDIRRVVKEGRRLAVGECRRLMSNRVWNCSDDHTGNLRQILKSSTPEAALLQALTSASIAFHVARVCDLPPSRNNSNRLLSFCERCRHRLSSGRITSTSTHFQWSGCPDNVELGLRIARKYTTKKSANEPAKDVPAIVELHNHRVGRRAIRLHYVPKRHCHGLSGSCRCWGSLPPRFETIGTSLLREYTKAKRVESTNSLEGGLVLEDGDQLRRRDKHHLVFTRRLPDHCRPPENFRFLRPRDRVCKSPANCKRICCAGYRKHRSHEKRPVNCRLTVNDGKFDVTCESTYVSTYVYRCN